MLMSLSACGETNNSKNLVTQTEEIEIKSSPQENNLDKSKIIAFFKSINYPNIPWSENILRVKDIDENTTTYKFDFSKITEQEKMDRFGGRTTKDIYNTFNLSNGKVISSKLGYIAYDHRLDATISVNGDDIIFHVVLHGRYSTDGTIFKNGEEVSTINFPDYDENKMKTFLENVKTSSSKTPKKEVAMNEDFNTFFKKFKSNSQFQKERIIFPIIIAESGFGGDPDIETKYNKSNWEFIDFSSLNEPGGFKEFNEKSDKYINLTVGIKNSDVYANYLFKKKNGLWHLTKIER